MTVDEALEAGWTFRGGQVVYGDDEADLLRTLAGVVRREGRPGGLAPGRTLPLERVA